MHGRRRYYINTFPERKWQEIHPDHMKSNRSTSFLNPSRSPRHHSEIIHFPVHNEDRSNSMFHSFEKSESSSHHFERNRSPRDYIARNKSPDRYLGRGRSLVRYSRESRSSVYYPEQNEERSKSPPYLEKIATSVFHSETNKSPTHYIKSDSSVYHLEQYMSSGERRRSPNLERSTMSPVQYLEGNHSSFYNFERSSSSPVHYLERNHSPVFNLERRALSPVQYLERKHSPVFNLERSTMSPVQYLERNHSPVYNLERSISPPVHYLDRNHSPVFNLERSTMSPVHYLERNHSSVYNLERSTSSPVHYLERNHSPVFNLERSTMSPVHYLERIHSPVYNLERSISSPVHYLDRNHSPVYNLEKETLSPVHYMERNQSPAHDSQRNTSPVHYYQRTTMSPGRNESSCYYEEGSNRSPYYWPEKNNNESNTFKRSSSPYYCPEESDNLRNTQSPRAYFSKSKTRSPIPEKGFQVGCLESAPIPGNSETYEHIHASLEETIGSSLFLNHLPGNINKNFHQTNENGPHSSRPDTFKTRRIKRENRRRYKNLKRLKKMSLEGIEKMTDDQINAFHLSGASERKVKKIIYYQGFSYTQAKRFVIKENFLRDSKLVQLKDGRTDKKEHSVSKMSLSEPSTSVSDYKTDVGDLSKLNQHSTSTSTVQENCSKLPSSVQQALQNPESKPIRLEDKPEDVSVVPIGYPNTSLSYNKLKLLYNAIISALNRLPSDEPRIRFKQSKFKPGYLKVTCADKLSADWLKRTVGQLKPWNGCVLTTLGKDKGVPKPVRCQVFVPDEHGERLSGQKIVTRLNVGNKGLNSHLWVAESKDPVEKGQLWTFAMDLESFELLKKLNMKPYFGFNSLKFNRTR